MVFEFIRSVVYSVSVDPKRMCSEDEIVLFQATIGILYRAFLKCRHLYPEVERVEHLLSTFKLTSFFLFR